MRQRPVYHRPEPLLLIFQDHSFPPIDRYQSFTEYRILESGFDRKRIKWDLFFIKNIPSHDIIMRIIEDLLAFNVSRQVFQIQRRNIMISIQFIRQYSLWCKEDHG